MKAVWSFFFIIVIGLLIPMGSAAPGDILWQQVLGGSDGEEWGYSLDSVSDGGILVSGSASSTDANISGLQENGDLWLVRLDPNGNPLWNRAYGGNGSDYSFSIKATPDGGSVIVGTTGSSDGNIAGYHGNGDLWVIRLSPNGDRIWNRVYGGNMTDEGGDILVTPDGGYMVIGYTMSNDGDPVGHHGGGDLWMLRLDQNGSILWQKILGGSMRESGSSIVSTSDGGYAMTGNTYSADGDVTSNHGSSDLWVVKTDGNGSVLWQKSYGGSKLDWGHSITEMTNGDLMVAGVTASSDGDVHLNHGVGDVWVLRLSSAGDLLWEKTYGGNFSDNVWKMEPSPIGGAYLVGETFSVDGDISGNHGDADLWVAEIDANGALLWNRTLGGSMYESGSWVHLMPDGNLVVTGTTRSSDGDIPGAPGEGDLWVAKIDAKINATLPITKPIPITPVLNHTIPEVVNLSLPTENATTILVPTPVPGNLSEILVPPTNITPKEEGNVTIPEVAIPNSSSDNLTSGGNETAPLLVSPNATAGSDMIVAIPGVNLTPGDPDGDGRYEDLNANGKIDLQDPTIFFTNIDWIKEHEPVYPFDFNGNGVIEFGDISTIFEEASG